MKLFQDYLENIIRKDLGSLSKDDIQFLKARRSYLTGDQLAKFESVLQGKTKIPVVMDKPKEQIAYRELQTQASALGFEKPVGATREELTKYIQEHKTA